MRKWPAKNEEEEIVYKNMTMDGWTGILTIDYIGAKEDYEQLRKKKEKQTTNEETKEILKDFEQQSINLKNMIEDIDITDPALWARINESRNIKITPVERYSFTKKELKGKLKELERLEELTRIKMKKKKYYHTFNYEGRTINLCLYVEAKEYSNDAGIHVGYAVCLPEDEYNEEIAKRISSGRAQKDSSMLKYYSMQTELAFSLKVLKGIAEHLERRIKKGKIEIKGIRDKKCK